eukprot:9493689-Lingulodinium_polyedra.AAC.1
MRSGALYRPRRKLASLPLHRLASSGRATEWHTFSAQPLQTQAGDLAVMLECAKSGRHAEAHF